MAAKKQQTPKKSKGGRPKEHTPEYIAEVGRDLLEWSKRDDALFLDGFLAEYKYLVSNQSLSLWAKDNKPFSETLKKVKLTLINRLKVNSCTKKYDGAFVIRILPLVDPDFREWRREELKVDTAKKETFTLYIHPDRCTASDKDSNE